MANSLSARLGIDYPIFAFTHCRDVVVAVSKAGGIGVLGAVGFSPEQLKEELDWIDEHIGDRPYGVDIVIPQKYEGMDSVSAEEMEKKLWDMVPQEHIEFAQQLLANAGVPEWPDGSKTMGLMGWTDATATPLLEEALTRPKCKLIANALGTPPAEKIKQVKDSGRLIGALCGKVKQAVAHKEAGLDFVIAQGGEGGGHTGAVPTTLLLPQVVDAVGDKVPVVAAGGFKDGRGLAAALAWGADGIAMGTRFLLTRESPVPEATKQRYLDCHNPGEIIVSKAMDGLPQRMIMNQMLAELERASAVKKLWIAFSNGLRFRKFTGASLTSLFKSALAMTRSGDVTMAQAIMSANAPMIIQKAMVEGQPEEGVLPSGQVAGVIDRLLSCEEIIEGIAREAEQRLQVLAQRVS